MGRSEAKDTNKQALATSSQDQANAGKALASTNQGLTDYTAGVNRFMNFGRKTYGEGGEYQSTANTLANTAASAGHTALEGDLALRSARTGENTAGYATAAGEDSRARQRDAVNMMAQSNADRLKNLTAVEQYGVDASKLPPQIQASIYGTSVGGANSSLGAAADSSKVPGFWDTMAPALIQGAATVGAGFTPKGCWIAEAIYGPSDYRTYLVRRWLNTEFIKSLGGKLVMALYVRFGERVAVRVRANAWMRFAFKPLFNRALDRAIKTGS